MCLCAALPEHAVTRAASTGSATDFMPERRTLPALREAAAGCRGCQLWTRGTQTVFGEGPRRARVMLVGEQPGNDEDLAGKPFVGPAGRVLDRALETAGIARGDVYVTNVVKHFKWEPKGKRRIHAKPNQLEIAACLPWLEAELDIVKPAVLVCLGATAAQALLGPKFRVTKQRGEWMPSRWASHVMATVHPSAILRAPDDAARHAEMERFVADLKHIPPVLAARAA
jgi:uracil-DNA glycosylase